MRRVLPILVTLAAWLGAAGAAQAIVVDMNPSALGKSLTVTYPTDQSYYYGVAMVPGNDSLLTTAGVPTVSTATACTDPWLSLDLVQPQRALCWHSGGTVMHGNETFSLTWDPDRRYWATTRDYVQQFLKDVADGSGTFTSPYAVTTQYADGLPDSKDAANTSGRAENASIYGGGCIDYGNPGGYTCQFANTNGSGTGNNYPQGAGSCQAIVTGINQWATLPAGFFGQATNDVCVTDADIRGEVTAMVSQLQGHFKPGYTPTVVVTTPPGVEVCLDATGTLCSANGLPVLDTPTGQVAATKAAFCSYHSTVNGIAYVVQPWTASWTVALGCDEPDAPPIPNPAPAQQLAVDAGIRLVSPISQSQIAAIVNPSLNGWFANDGHEINDNFGCIPLAKGLDSVTVGKSSQNPYLLQRQFNDAGLIESDPNALACAPSVGLVPTFVVPSAVNKGDVVQFDGSTTVSTLMVPKANYQWSFGDGTTAVGPSVQHSYATAGSYTVKLTVTDRGGNTTAFSQSISVLGAQGQVVTPPPSQSNPGLQARLQLLPQGLRAMLRSGMAIRVTANQAADGIATLSISRAAAKRAHISLGHGTAVVIGRGTVSGVKSGTVNLYLRVSRAMAKKLAPLGHVTLTVRLMLVAAGRNHLAIDAAAHY